MRRFFNLALVLAGAFLFVFPQNAHAQFTTVTATVTDPNGIPYAGAIMNAILMPGASGGYTLQGNPYSGRVGPVTLDSTGSFTAQFGDVTLITPGSPQWQLTIDSAAASVPGPIGTGPQSFIFTSTGTTISGGSPVSLTASLAGLAPKLTNIASGSGALVSSLPATCTPGVTPSVQLSTLPYFSYYCGATNGWIPIGGGSFGAASSGGIAQAQTVSLIPPLTAAGLVPLVQICWLPIAANTAAGPTLAGSGGSTFPATPITKGVSGTTALLPGDLEPNVTACAIYNGTNFVLQNPQTQTFNSQTVGTAAETLGASPSASASTNTTALQSALNVTGLVTLSTCGTYSLNGHLVIKGNTTFRKLACVKLFQANATNDNLLINNAYANRGFVQNLSETYVSGVGTTCTPSSTQTVTFTNGNPAIAAIGTITINGSGAPTGKVTIGLPPGTNGGALYQAAPTTGTITSCTGTATFNLGAITGAGTAVTLTYTSGMTMSVAWTTHGFTAGQYVLLAGSTPSNFNGVFKITSITDANDFVVELLRFPLSGPSGTAVGLACDQHIVLDGGVWDYNGANQTTASNQLADSIIIGFAQDVKITNTIVNNSNKYAFGFGAVRDVTTDQNGSDFTLSDEIKVFGPAANIALLHTFGKNGDDGISFQTNPGGSAGFPQTNWSTGDILNAGVDGVDLEDPGGTSLGAVVFYPTDTTSYMGGLYAKNVSGVRDNTCVAISGIASSTLDTLRTENINCSGTHEVYFNTVTIGTLQIDNETFNGNASSGTGTDLLFENSVSATVNNLILTGCNLNNTGIPSSGAMTFVQLNGTVNNFTAKNCLINGSTGGSTPARFLAFFSGSVAGKVTIDSVDAPNGDNFITLNSGTTGTPVITVRDSTIGTHAIVTSLGVNTNLAFFGNSFANCSNGCIRTTLTPTINIAGNGNTLSAGSWIVIASGTPVFTYSENTDVNSPTCFNVTPVTVNTNTTGDQNLMACTLPSSSLNSVKRTLSIGVKTVYSTPAASTATLNLKIKLCTVSGCGSGTVITPISITSSANPGTVTNNTMSLSSLVTTQTAGTSAAFEASGSLLIDLGALTTAADTIFADTNTATVGTIDSTAQLFLQVTGAFSAASGSNSITERQLVVKEY